MDSTLDERQSPQVWEDHSTLRGEVVGTETQYTIALKGLVDDRWAEAYRITQGESVGFQRFRLNRATASIGFSCRTVDGAVQVFDMLEQLETFLKTVNERLEFWRTQNPAITFSHAARGVA